MIWFKSCPRCETGAVVLDKDYFGEHILCLQCGYMKDLDGAYRLEDFQGDSKLKVVVKREREPVAV